MSIKRLMFCMLFLGTLWANGQTVSPMLTSHFRQDSPYNDSCPQQTAAGCGPVAIAQILKYYEQPVHGFGKVAYESGTEKIPINLDLDQISFQWKHILPSYDTEYTPIEAKSVADLIFACGAATHVQYGASTSMNNYALALYGMQHHLHISPQCMYLRRKNFSTAEWLEILNAQLVARHPVLYRGTKCFDGKEWGHLFVIDGMDQQGKYHVNFGSYPKFDKFTDINILNQSGDYPGEGTVCYNVAQAMFINMVPTPDAHDYLFQQSISEEAIILNKDTLLQEAELNIGETFTLSCRLRNCCDSTARISFGWGLTRDNQPTTMLCRYRYRLGAGNTFVHAVHCQMKIPENLEEGHYTLSLFSSLNGDENWQKVGESVKSDVQVTVQNGHVVLSLPNNHLGYTDLYLNKKVIQIKNRFAKAYPGKVFQMEVVNGTENNFQGPMKLEITSEGEKSVFPFTQAIYSQSCQMLNILVPQQRINLEGKKITSVKVFYYSELEGTYLEVKEKSVDGIETQPAIAPATGSLRVYTLNGTLVKVIEAADVTDDYSLLLRTLPHGIYLVKDKTQTRKVML